MDTKFWIKRFLTVLAGAFVVICAAQLLQGRNLHHSALHGGIWALLSATVFTVSRYFQARRGQHCAVCRDTPEMQHPEHGGDA
jgi:hypothetical protein